MGDYGLRISHDGYDVKTCDDIDCVVTSKYSNLKGTISGTVTITKTTDPQTSTLVAHNLGYHPICFVYFYNSSTAKANSLPFPVVQGFPFYSYFTDNNNLYIKMIIVPNADYTFKYFIFLDKGKL